MSDDRWTPSSQPPDTSRTVMLRFDADGSRDAHGFYWRVEGAWYKSQGSKAKRKSVHPIAWREINKGDA